MSPRRATSSAAGFFSSPPPSVAVEITGTRVTAVSLGEQGGTRVVSAYASAQLPVGAVEPALNSVNVHNPAALTAAIKAVLDKAAARVRRIALVLPDTVAKVSLIRFEKIPARGQDLEQLIQWQVRKAAPFRIEDALVAWQPGVDVAGAGREYVVTVARKDIIQSYERACEAAGVHAGLIDLASFNVMNAMLAAFGSQPQGDWLLVHVAPDYWTLVVVRGGTLVFFRNRASSGDADLADLVHQTAMYHEDRLGGGGFSRVILAGASVQGAELAERLRRALEERIGTRVEPIDFRAAASMRDRISAGPDLLDTLTPSIGILLRERVA